MSKWSLDQGITACGPASAPASWVQTGKLERGHTSLRLLAGARLTPLAIMCGWWSQSPAARVFSAVASLVLPPTRLSPETALEGPYGRATLDMNQRCCRDVSQRDNKYLRVCVKPSTDT